MATDLNRVSRFQIDNLIKNRVPFALVNLGVELTDLYDSIYLQHAQQQTVSGRQMQKSQDGNSTFSNEEALAQLQSQNIPKHTPVLILCPDGVQSEQLCSLLESQGYMNVYYAAKGWTGLKHENES